MSITDPESKRFHEALDLMAAKVAEDEQVLGVSFPYVTFPDGQWDTMLASHSAGYSGENWSHGNWFCGFWIGLLLAAGLRTGEARFSALAEERMRLVGHRADDPNTHDIGFIFNSSAVPGAHIHKSDWYRDFAIRAAERLRRRAVVTRKGAYLSSWGPHDDPRGRSSSAIDTMANIPLLYWAGSITGDDSFRLVGECHAKMTRDAFIREDMSTYHAVEYDLQTGERVRGYTFQGFGDESAWSRGQAWAILGFAATAQATGDLQYLALADRLADYFLDRMGADTAPYWDFDDPAIPDAPRDSSAAAIVATALLDMASLHPDRVKGENRQAQAISLLQRLCDAHLATEPSHRGVLRDGCYSRPHGIGVSSAVLFGDFYFVEALCKVVMPGRFRPIAALGGPIPALGGTTSKDEQ